MRIYLIRHGDTQTNGHGVYGDEAPLTALGRSQAEQVADALKGRGITSIVTSPAVRARQTAQPFEQAVGMSATVIPHFNEIAIGPLIRGTTPYQPLLLDGKILMDCTHNEGESFDLFSRRVLTGLGDLIADFSHHESVAVFTHSGVKSVLMDHCAGREVSRVMHTFYANGSISSMDALDSGFTVHTVNDVAHLQP